MPYFTKVSMRGSEEEEEVFMERLYRSSSRKYLFP
jgi:hypothetical protein